MKIPSPHKCLHRTTAVLGLRKARMAVRIRLQARVLGYHNAGTLINQRGRLHRWKEGQAITL